MDRPTEGIVPAPESAHAIRAAMDLALGSWRDSRAEVILFGVSGHGNFNMTACENYLPGKCRAMNTPRRDIEMPWPSSK